VRRAGDRARRRGPLRPAWAPALVATLALVTTLGTAVLAQVDRSEQQRLEQELAVGQRVLEERRAEIDAITRELGATEASLRERIAERDRVSARLVELDRERTELLASIAALEGDRDATLARIADLEGDLALMQERVQGLLVSLHRSRTARIAGVLGGAESFHDLRVKQRFVGLMAAQDVAVVTELDALLGDLTAARAALDGQLRELEEHRAALDANALALEGTRVQLETLIAELESTQAGQRAQQRALLEAQDQLEAQLAALDRALAQEIARLEAEERRLRQQAQEFVDDRARQVALESQADEVRARIDNLAQPTPAPAAGYVSPLDDAVVTTRFGEGNFSFVSLRASQPDAAVRAVRGGVVMQVAPLGANEGYMVAVRHDETLTTVYTNLRPPVVAIGEAVAGGQVIGYLGGGTLVPADVLRFYVRRTDAGGRAVFVDPAPVLGL
jgi:septal ring factor EnvC (AmiA/AmiB activator)